MDDKKKMVELTEDEIQSLKRLAQEKREEQERIEEEKREELERSEAEEMVSPFRTEVINDMGGDMRDWASPVFGFVFNIPFGESRRVSTEDVYNPFCRYARIEYLPGRTVKVWSQDHSSYQVKVSFKGIKLTVRKGWVEPPREFPVCEFVNMGGANAQVYTIPLSTNYDDKVRLAQGIPVLKTVPVNHKYAKFKRIEVYPSNLGPAKFKYLKKRTGAELRKLEELQAEKKREFLNFLATQKTA